MSHRLRYAARSDRGLVRANNQDSVYAGDRLLVVADGMGGHAAGDLASRVVVAAFTDLDSDSPGDDLTSPLHQAIRSGNEAIAELVDEDPDLDGMGTTVTAMLFDGDRMALAHIGDSRAYLYRDGVLHQLSHDDTFVQSLVDEGRITEEEATHHPQRNLLLRALNGSDADPMLSLRQIHVGDRYMVCSDGLSSVIAAEAIADGLAEPDADTAADRLVELALVAGGPDNVTVIVADVLEVGARSTIPTGVYDPEATGPMRPLHETQRMPRVPLPPLEEARLGVAPGAPDDEDDLDDDTSEDEQDDEPSPAARRRKIRFRLALAAAIVVALAATVAGLVVWGRDQYYVGVADDGTVVVYRGLNGNILGFTFADVAETSCVVDPAAPGTPCGPLYVDDLQQSAKDLVNAGSPAGDLAAARDVIGQLQARLLPLCTEPTGGIPSSASDQPSTPPASTPASTTGPGSSGDDSRSDTSRSAANDTRSGGSSSRASRPTRSTDPNNRLRAGATALSTPASDEPAPAAAGRAVDQAVRSVDELRRTERQGVSTTASAVPAPPVSTPAITLDPTVPGTPPPCRVRR
ncbi:MAG: protein phosphatase 2C domain-containing protein [Nakamurella sp.]